MNGLIKRAGRFFVDLVPSESPILYRACKRYVDRYNGENNSDIRTNGELRFMQRVLPRCQTVFDVGANVGDWTALALSINAGLAVHCFEPSRFTYQKLLEREFPPQVICNNFGLSSFVKETKLHVFDTGSPLNSLYPRAGLDELGIQSQRQEEVIQLSTVDRYCRERSVAQIDFLKLDVEGHELEVFRGMTESLSQGRVQMIQFEYGGCNIDAGALLKDIWQFFERRGYAFYKIYPKGIKPAERYSQSFENFQYQNWAVIRNGAPLALV
jgi:FkbM family methyltransferase